MKRSALGACALGVALLLGACATPTIDPSLLSPAPSAGAQEVAGVRPGDVIEVSFYRNLQLENAAYKIGVGDLLRVDVYQYRELRLEEATAYKIGTGDLLRVDLFENQDVRLEGAPYNIQVSDILSVDVYEQPEISRDRVMVLLDGTVSLPLIGSVRAAGRNVDDLSAELDARYANQGILRPQVTVAVAEGEPRQQQPEVSRERVVVLPDGNVSLPLLGSVRAAGKSTNELGVELAESYGTQGFRSPQVTVAVEEGLRQPALPNLSREGVTVLPDGSVSLPLIGNVQVGGKSVDELSAEMRESYAARGVRKPQVTVSVEQSDQRLEAFLQSVSAGPAGDSTIEVNVPRSGPLNLPLIPAVATSQSLVDIQREISTGYARTFGGRVATTVQLSNEVAQFAYVMGHVTAPGGVPITPLFNPMRAIAAAGGFLPTAHPNQVLVVRFKGDGSYDQWMFDVQGGLDTGRHDVASLQLRAGDVVYVPQSGISRANQFVAEYIRGMLPFNVSTGVFFDPTD